MRLIRTLLVLGAAVTPATASAHFPFLHLKDEGGKEPVLHVYFAETAEPDDAALLDRLAGAEAWRLAEGHALEPVALRKGENSLVGKGGGRGPAAFGLTKDYGVLSRGGQPPFRLMYYAKTYSARDAWTIATADRLALDVAPSRHGEELTLTVAWKGKPLANAEVVVQGGIESVEGVTDSHGRFTCRLADPDLYSIRAKHVEQSSGETAGKPYDEVRHYSTLTLNLD